MLADPGARIPIVVSGIFNLIVCVRLLFFTICSTGFTIFVCFNLFEAKVCQSLLGKSMSSAYACWFGYTGKYFHFSLFLSKDPLTPVPATFSFRFDFMFEI